MTRLRVILPVAAICAVLFGVLTPPAYAGAASSTTPEASIATVKPQYAPGERVQITMSVRNPGSNPCRLAATADGTVEILKVTRDGQPVTAGFGNVFYAVGHNRVLEQATREVAGGQSISFDLSDQGGLRAVSPLPSGNGLATQWTLDTPGRYSVKAAYRSPAGQGVCASRSTIATVDFLVQDKAFLGTPKFWLLIVAVAFGVLAIVLLIVLKRRRRAVASAIILVLAVTLIVGTRPAPAAATIDSPTAAGAFKTELATCLGTLRANDPAKIMQYLDSKKYKVEIAETKGQENVKTTGDTTSAFIRWDAFDKNPMIGEPTVNFEPCPALYHELTHAFDMGNNQIHLDKCGSGPPHKLASIADARAVRAENKLRATPRKTYSGRQLPAGTDPDLKKVLEDCKKNNITRPKPGPHKANYTDPTGPGGGSNGDPHLVTFDQNRYDLQSVGEFVLAKSGDLEVHVRQAPFAGSRTVSVNAAAGLRVGPDRVTFTMVDGNLQIRRNDKDLIVGDDGVVLPGAGTIAVEADQYQVAWPDGTLANIVQIGGWGLWVQLYPVATRKGTFTGLLGNFDGDQANDLSNRDGSPVAPSHDQLHGPYADSWRLKQSESLLYYPPGTDTAKFTDKTFPDHAIGVADLTAENRARAEQICGQLGITDPIALRDCVLDLAVTGQPVFAVGSATSWEQLSAAGAPSAGGPQPGIPVSPGTTLRDGSHISGQVGTAGGANRYPLELNGAKQFFVADWLGTSDRCDQSFSVNLVGVSNSNFPCTNGIVTFTVPDPIARYELEIASAGGKTGSYSFSIVASKPRSLPISVGSTVQPGTGGRIDIRGREDTYEFTASGATAIRITQTSGCDTAVFADIRDLTNSTFVGGANPLCGNELGPYQLPDQTHRYAIVVRSVELKVGDYGFRLEAA